MASQADLMLVSYSDTSLTTSTSSLNEWARLTSHGRKPFGRQIRSLSFGRGRPLV